MITRRYYMEYVQSTPLATWVVKHNFGRLPVVDVYMEIDGVQAKVIPSEVKRVDDNTVSIEFGEPVVGTAVLV